jgi:F1F0 ATPase subunit 2
MHHDGMTLALAALGGGALGLFFFGGLWWTVRALARARRGALFLLASLLLRGGATLAGFYWLGAGRWHSMLACLLGFIAARALVLRLGRAGAEARHAP